MSTPALVGLLHENTGFKERPGGVFGIEFDPFVNTRAGDDAVDDAADDAVDARFVSYGKKHVKAWTRLARTNEWVSRPMSFGSHGVRDVCSVAFLPPKSGKNRKAALVTGHPDGSLLVWRGGAAVQKIEGAHGRGARAIQPDGSVAWGGGVRAMRLRLGSETGDHGDHGDHGAALVTGGADGALAQWAVVDGTLAGKITEPLVLAESPRNRPGVAISNASDAGVRHAGVRAIDIVPGTDRVVAGTSRCELWDVDLHPERETASVLTRGHKASLRAACWHPSDPDRLYTACASGAVHAWDAARTAMTRRCALAFAATCIAVGGDAARDTQTHVAVGGEDGEVLVLTESSFEVVFAAKDARGAGAEDLKFSPDGGSRLAVTYRDGKVEVFRRYAADRKGPRYEKMARFKGHSASARHVDWSADGATLATCGADYEILHWDVPLARRFVEGASARSETRGAQNLSGQRDRRFATRTAVLGFPVMGVWPSASDGTDVNALDVSPCGRYAVTADDGGFVKLFAYPVLAESAPHRAYRGHAGHVAMVRFNCDGTRVVSAGGRDRAAFQFSLRRRPEPAPAPPPRARRWLPLDASGKAFGFREPREGEAEAEDEDAILARKETLDELDSDEILEDREADLPVFVPRREDVFAGSEPSGSEPASSLLEVDANALSASVSRRSRGEKTNGNGNGNENENDSIRSGWRPLRQLVTTMAAFGSPSRKARAERGAGDSGSPAPSARAPPDSDSEPEIDEDLGTGGTSSEEVLEEIEA